MRKAFKRPVTKSRENKDNNNSRDECMPGGWGVGVLSSGKISFLFSPKSKMMSTIYLRVRLLSSGL